MADAIVEDIHGSAAGDDSRPATAPVEGADTRIHCACGSRSSGLPVVSGGLAWPLLA